MIAQESNPSGAAMGMQPSNNCWLVHQQPTSLCRALAQPGLAARLLPPHQAVAKSHCPLCLQPEKVPSPLIIPLVNKPSDDKPLAPAVVELDRNNNELQGF